MIYFNNSELHFCYLPDEFSVNTKTLPLHVEEIWHCWRLYCLTCQSAEGLLDFRLFFFFLNLTPHSCSFVFSRILQPAGKRLTFTAQCFLLTSVSLHTHRSLNISASQFWISSNQRFFVMKTKSNHWMNITTFNPSWKTNIDYCRTHDSHATELTTIRALFLGVSEAIAPKSG